MRGRVLVATLLAGALLAIEAPGLAQEGRLDPELADWSAWWERNQAPYLDLKGRLHRRSDEPVSGRASCGFCVAAMDTRPGPTQEQIQQTVVPALLASLRLDTDDEVVTRCLLALAKIGDSNVEVGRSKLAPVFEEYLFDRDPEIRETATIALGILAHESAIPTLKALASDTREGRRLVGTTGVPYRTRAFAAYGLGLIGAVTAREEARREIVRTLVDVLETEETRSPDLAVASVIALGLVPVATIEPTSEDLLPRPYESRVGQLHYVLDYLRNEDNLVLARAHCPTALVRLLERLPEEEYVIWRVRIVDDLRERASDRRGEPEEVVQSAVLALGSIVTNGEPDRATRDVLEAGPRFRNPSARSFSMIAMARAGGSIGCRGGMEAVIDQAAEFLLEHLVHGAPSLRPWAGLGIGLMIRRSFDSDVRIPKLHVLADALRAALREERDPARLGAYAIAVGMTGDMEAADTLLERLEQTMDDDARGHLAVALGLMSEREAIAPLRGIVQESKDRPELLRRAAVALALLGSTELVPDLVGMLAEARDSATRAAIVPALGLVGDRRSIEPLVELLEDPGVTPHVRALAAQALGNVAEKEPLPWNTKIGLDLDYRAATETLIDPRPGTGILDLP